MKEDLNLLHREAECLRTHEIREACSSGRVIVNDPYFFSDNPHWMNMARTRLYGNGNECGFSIESPREDPRFVQTPTDFIGEYLATLPTQTTATRKMQMQHLKTQKKLNAKQDYTRFGGSKKIFANKKK